MAHNSEEMNRRDFLGLLAVVLTIPTGLSFGESEKSPISAHDGSAIMDGFETFNRMRSMMERGESPAFIYGNYRLRFASATLWTTAGAFIVSSCAAHIDGNGKLISDGMNKRGIFLIPTMAWFDSQKDAEDALIEEIRTGGGISFDEFSDLFPLNLPSSLK